MMDNLANLLLTVNPDERAILVGATGSGKSVLGRELLKRAKNKHLIIIDGKNGFGSYAGLPVKRKVSKGTKSYIYVPLEDEINNLEAYNTVLKQAYDQGDTLVYIDDVMIVCDKHGSNFPRYLQVIAQMGRSKNVSLITASQRAYRIPLFLMSEANKFYTFRTNMASDWERIRDFDSGYYPGDLQEYEFRAYDVRSKQGANMKLKRGNQ